VNCLLLPNKQLTLPLQMWEGFKEGSVDPPTVFDASHALMALSLNRMRQIMEAKCSKEGIEVPYDEDASAAAYYVKILIDATGV
jgi:hypothetical protein